MSTVEMKEKPVTEEVSKPEVVEVSMPEVKSLMGKSDEELLQLLNEDDGPSLFSKYPLKELVLTQMGHLGFLFVEDTVRAVLMAFLTGRNLVLYGERGHGKSDPAFKLITMLGGEEPYVKTLTPDTDPVDLFGGLDLDAMNRADNPEMRTAIELGLPGFKYAVLEEAFDAPAHTLGALKDLLTRKEFRDGKQVAASKNELVVICTNLSPEEYSVKFQDPTTAALLDRFPLSQRVQWASPTPEHVESLIMSEGRESTQDELDCIRLSARIHKLHYGNVCLRTQDISLLATQVSTCADEENIAVSPRLVKQAMIPVLKGQATLRGRGYVDPLDYSALKMITDLSYSKLSTVESAIQIEKTQRLDDFQVEAFKHASKSATELKEELDSLFSQIQNLKSCDSMRFGEFTSAGYRIQETAQAYRKAVSNIPGREGSIPISEMDDVRDLLQTIFVSAGNVPDMLVDAVRKTDSTLMDVPDLSPADGVIQKYTEAAALEKKEQGEDE